MQSVDPILNPVLNKEIQKQGGRTLIRLGSEDIDFSPKFFLILTTVSPSRNILYLDRLLFYMSIMIKD